MERLTGRDFEQIVLFRAEKLEQDGRLCLGRYGVQVTMMRDPVTQEMKMQPMRSLPDFEGTIEGGLQLIIEAKVCSGASYPLLTTSKKHPRQIEHMLKRARFGARCYLLVHFNGRQLVAKMDEPATFAFEVNADMRLWKEFLSGERKSISRADAELIGIPVPWNKWSGRATKESPDIGVLLPVQEFQLHNTFST